MSYGRVLAVAARQTTTAIRSCNTISWLIVGYLTQFAVSATPYTQCVAVSTGPDPTGTYFRYAFSYSRSFNDYPKMGVWPDAYYISYNMFRNGAFFHG